MQSKPRAQAEVQAQRKKVSRPRIAIHAPLLTPPQLADSYKQLLE